MTKTLYLTSRVDAVMEWFTPWLIVTFHQLVEWICRDGVVSVYCIFFSIYAWIRLVCRSIFYSWQWWIVYISGIWNAPDARSLRTIFIVDPGWAFEKPYQPISRITRRYYSDLQYELHKIQVKQIIACHQLHRQLLLPIILRMLRHSLWFLCCVVNIIELFGTLSWYSGRVFSWKLGILRPKAQLSHADELKSPFRRHCHLKSTKKIGTDVFHI